MPTRTFSAMEMILPAAVTSGGSGRDRLCLADHRLYEVIIRTSARLQRVQYCRHGGRQITRVGRLLGGSGSRVFDRGTETAQVQDPRPDRGGTADGDPARS